MTGRLPPLNALRAFEAAARRPNFTRAALRLVDFAREDVDVAIRYGAGRWPGVQAELLLTTGALPGVRPTLLGGPSPDDAAGPAAPRPAAR